jgi:hypothetical protein
MLKRERTMAKERFSENPKIKVTAKKSKFKKVKISPPSRSGRQDAKKWIHGATRAGRLWLQFHLITATPCSGLREVERIVAKDRGLPRRMSKLEERRSSPWAGRLGVLIPRKESNAMKRVSTTSIALAPTDTGAVGKAWDEVSASFDRFCLAAGIDALGAMMEKDAEEACGARHARS